MRPNDEKLTEKITETRLGIGVGKGLRGQQGHMMESLARGCMAAEWEGGFGRRREVVGRGAGECGRRREVVGSGAGGGWEVREEGQVAARRIAYENKVLSDVCAQHS
jgi:hypothetical protein